MSENQGVRADFQNVDVYRTVHTLDTLSEMYGVARDQWVKLNQNENPYGPAPEAQAAMTHLALHRYPDTATTGLRQALGDYLGISADRIVCGNGGDEIIDVLFRLFMDPGDEAINCPPTFGFYPVAAKLNRTRLVSVPRDDQFRIDLKGIEGALTARTKLILLCSPNNPTGNLTDRADLAQVLEMGTPVLLDEAYVEFAGTSALALQDRFPHLMIVRTFSKWAGLAGLRVGYGIFSESFVGQVRAIRPAYTVNAAAEAAAEASVRNRTQLLAGVERICADRDALTPKLAETGLLTPWPSDTNFIYCTGGEKGSVGFVYEELLKRGVIVRLFANPDAVRITVGTGAENAQLLEALRDIGAIASRETFQSMAT